MIDLNTAAEQIWLDTQADCPNISIEVLPETDSTNTQLLARGRAGDTAPMLLAAHRQTAGRGRHGRQWVAQAGDSLTFSLGLPLDLDQVPGGGSALSLAVGLAIAQALDTGLASLPGPARQPITLKWPNDLWCQQRKLGGILIEATPAPGLTAGQRWVVIGVGVNLRPQGDPAKGLDHACLQELGTAPLTAGQVWGWIAPPLLRAVQRFALTGFAPLQAAYAQRDALAGQDVALWRAVSGNALLRGAPTDTGRADGVDQQGALLVHTVAGLQRWTTGDVSVRLAASAPPPTPPLA
ncbi:biotin--[acetyl-CoA-carboxylase] ligase [Aquabacterium sp.]|uniref:biotin--[acetyl-CoA-carboxylase] ligase n=1 Tax=Aquabacterium sp. TaxID=1872578 RepID=UPI00198F943D|nr:biotin--[acetyl-CoA-carboxylase] ligase [Aquabacterium sp.]MBC7700985.1 biotin--[acetyl-CoA-carboxylase] ligase [Aquabacterium sp.]